MLCLIYVVVLTLIHYAVIVAGKYQSLELIHLEYIEKIFCGQQ